MFYNSGPQLFRHQRLVLWKTVFSQTGVGDGFRMIQVHHIYCVLYIYHYYVAICNEIIIHLFTMQNPRDPWACFPATRRSLLGEMGDSDTQSVLLMSSLLYNFVLVFVTAEHPASQR